MTNPKSPNNHVLYTCSHCNYITTNKKDYNKHLHTAKHLRLTNTIPSPPKNPIVCVCGKEYKHYSSLCKHKRTCNREPPSNEESSSNKIDKDDLIIELLKENREFKQLIIDQNKQMMEMSKNMGGNHHTTNNNTNCNNKFNLNVFLNEKCKDAMSLKDFVNSMNISLEDYVQTGELGFVEGISKTIVKCINDMELYDRPLHCTDLKRETIYIKGGEKWEKDEDKVEFRKAVKRIANKNHKMTSVWMENTPDVNTIGTDNYEKFFTYMQSSLGGCGQDETKLFEDKIMRNVMREVTIDKKAVMD